MRIIQLLYRHSHSTLKQRHAVDYVASYIRRGGRATHHNKGMVVGSILCYPEKLLCPLGNNMEEQLRVIMNMNIFDVL